MFSIVRFILGMLLVGYIFDKFVLLQVEGERTYHQRIATILGEVEAEVSPCSCFHGRFVFIREKLSSCFDL